MKAVKYWLLFSFLGSVWVGCQQPNPDAWYMQRGAAISRQVQQKLGSVLMQHMKEAGPVGAIKFCNTQAIPLTQSFEDSGITIQRISLKNRNEANALSMGETMIWKTFVQAKLANDSIQPILVSTDSTVDYYQPILLQANCLPCHGKEGSEMSAAVVAALDSLYPNDKARNFAVGDIRGIWKIRFPKQ